EAAAVIGNGLGNLVEHSLQTGGILSGSESGEIAVVGLLGDSGTAMNVGDALAERTPPELAVCVVAEGSEDLKASRVGHGGLDSQDVVRVVHLDRVALHPVLHAHAFLALLEAAGHLAEESTVALAPEETHDIATLEVQRRVPNELWIDRIE